MYLSNMPEHVDIQGKPIIFALLLIFISEMDFPEDPIITEKISLYAPNHLKHNREIEITG